MRRSRQRLIFATRRRSHRRVIALLALATALTVLLGSGIVDSCSERRAALLVEAAGH